MLGHHLSDVRTSLARRRGLAFVAIAIACGVLLGPRDARAEQANDYCRKVSAQAQSDASLLMAPSVSAQLIRYPANNVADVTGLQVGKGIQPRASVTYGVVDMYRGLGVLDVASTDCRRQEVAAQLQEVVIARADIGRLPALESELTFLEAKRPALASVIRESEERLAARTTTFVEVHELKKSVLEVDRKSFTASRDAAVLRRRGFRMPARSLPEMLNAYDERALSYEEAISHVRKVQAWKLDVSGGIATTPVVDYFAVASLSYNFGGLFQGPAEHREIDAREHEIKNARYELRHQIETILDELKVEVEQGKKELRAYDDELLRIEHERASLDSLDAPNKTSVLAGLAIEAVSLGADRAYLDAYLNALSTFGGRP